MVLPLHREFFLAAAVTSLVFIAVTTLSIASTLGAVLAPIPLLYYYSRLGRMQGLLVFLVSLIVMMLALKVMNLYVSVMHVVLLGALGPVLSEVLRKNLSIERTVIYSVAALAVMGLCVLFYYSLVEDAAPWHLIEIAIAGMVQANIEAYARLGTSPEQLDLIRSNAGQIAGVLTRLVPSFFLAGMSFFVWVNILIGKLLFVRKGMWYPDFGNLSNWKIPDKVIWLVIAAGALLFIPVTTIRIVSINVLIILLFAYMMQGLSIVNFFFEKKNLPWFLKTVAYILIFVQQLLLVLIIGLGLIDVWVNFRKLDKVK